MLALLCFFLAVLALPFKSRRRLQAENAALRHQLIVLRRKVPGRVWLTNGDRWFLSWISMAEWLCRTSDRHVAPSAWIKCSSGETHLRRVLSAYAAYYNQARTHLALGKDAPLHRAFQRSGDIATIPILAGLHHQYLRI